VTRIISGTARGRRLRTPAGSGTRPTSDRVREALFSRLEHLDVLSGARVLDLYAGSGALGLEAASRGAASVVLVDSHRATAAVARANATVTGVGNVKVRADTVERVLAAGPRPGDQVDLVFLDPPYDLVEEDLAAVLYLLSGRDWLAPDALVVVERSSRSPEPAWPPGLETSGERRHGETRVWFAHFRGPDELA
jgi:16S rRNA (guanine966-N2)-methyltransferase